MMNRIKLLLASLAVVLGLTLIVGATRDLPATAQGMVTGRNAMLIDQLTDQVGEARLIQAAVNSGILDRTDAIAVERFFDNDEGDWEEQLEAMDPAQVYQVAVDAGLITQAEADDALTR